MASNKIIMAAHQQACRRNGLQGSEKLTDPAALREFLIHLFAISILWTHFRHADNWEEAGDIGNEQLNFQEYVCECGSTLIGLLTSVIVFTRFSMACKSLAMAHANEELDLVTLKSDFDQLDTNGSNSISFLEVSVSCVIIFVFSIISHTGFYDCYCFLYG